ncbi:neurogenic protein big brain [Trichonephila clavata]|uniref:Neurogenic protein big brain n=1 Tax=Trichonephila clavata TaxID=2740835 RepID=A0A8X6KZ01_TRICU|nr:neurogenic protein big brain [Trichonephila clavata]
MGCTLVSDSLSSWQGMGLELVLTFVVTFTMCSTADPNRKSLGSDSLAVGLAYLVCTLIALPATGASMNPARSLGPAFVSNTWTNHWIYWAGPVVGGLLAALIYEYIFDSPKKVLPTVKDRDDSEKDVSEIKDDSDSKTSSVISPRTQMAQTHVQPTVVGGPYYRPLTPHDGSSTMRPHSRSTYTSAKYIASPSGSMGNHQQMPNATYYSTLPRGSSYRSWNDYGSSTQFKF